MDGNVSKGNRPEKNYVTRKVTYTQQKEGRGKKPKKITLQIRYPDIIKLSDSDLLNFLRENEYLPKVSSDAKILNSTPKAYFKAVEKSKPHAFIGLICHD